MFFYEKLIKIVERTRVANDTYGFSDADMKI